MPTVPFRPKSRLPAICRYSESERERNLKEAAQWRKDDNEVGQRRKFGLKARHGCSIFEPRESSTADGLKIRSLLGSSAIFPDKSSAWAEVERLHLALNPVDSRQGVTFADLAQHYAEHELVDRSESILGEPLKCVLILSTSFLGMSTRNSSGTLLFGRTRGAILALLSVNCWIP